MEKIMKCPKCKCDNVHIATESVIRVGIMALAACNECDWRGMGLNQETVTGGIIKALFRVFK